MSSCKTCDNQSSIIETQSEITQKRIQNQVRVPSSMYTMNFAALNSVINNNNVGKKHDSYQRRLNKLKQKNNETSFINNLKTSNIIPTIGNKVSDYEIVSCNRNIDNYLTCGLDFNKYLQIQGTQKAYDNFSQLANVPNTLTLSTGDTSYNFEGYINDLTVIDDSGSKLEISYITGSQPDGTVSNIIQTTNIDKITFFIDFKISNLIGDLSSLEISDLSNSSFYTIFEIGKRYKGTSLILHKDLNDNITIEFFCGNRGDTDLNNVVYINNNFTSRLNERNIFVASFEKIGNSNLDFKQEFYLNNEKVFEKNVLKSDYPFFANSNYGFGKFFQNSSQNGDNDSKNIAIRNVYEDLGGGFSTVAKNSRPNILNIAGQFRIFNNTYQELVRSNYFSNL
jgi:hypothetical protein